MNEKYFKKTDMFFEANPDYCGIPATNKQISHAENKLNVVFNETYKEIILMYGGHLGIDLHAFTNSRN